MFPVRQIQLEQEEVREDLHKDSEENSKTLEDGALLCINLSQSF